MNSHKKNRAVEFIASGNYAEAFPVLEELLQIEPSIHVLGLLVVVSTKLGKWGKACQFAKQALGCIPEDSAMRASLAMILIRLKFFNEAVDEARKALDFNPEQLDAYEYLGHALLEVGKVEEAIRYLEKANQYFPENSNIIGRLGKAYTALFRTEDGEAFCRKAIALNPADADAFTNLGMALRYQERHVEALDNFKRAIQISPDHPYAHLDLGVTYLLMGNYREGWREYGYRIQTEGWKRDKFIRPSWDGRDFHGKKLLVHVEQGLGDTIQFLRFLPEVKKRGGEVIFECQPELLRWAEKHSGYDVLISKGSKRPPYDMHVYLMSIPELIGSELETLPSAFCPEDYKSPQNGKGDGVKVGIVWAGSPGHSDDKRRSTRLDYFLPLLQIPGISLVSLQKGRASEALVEVSGIIDGVKDCKDYADTARVIQDLDLVISVDTSVAHMSATLGKPTWMLLGFLPDWRWLLDREDSPWYPSVRLFRQRKLGAWDEQFDRVMGALKRLSPNKG